MDNEGVKPPGPIFRDIRRYYCEFCGTCRSKKSLITSHMLTHHQEEMKEKENEKQEEHGEKLNLCEECGASFRKPAYLKQHMQSHSLELVGKTLLCITGREALDPKQMNSKMLERPFSCPVDDCHSSYRRKDHLTRHLLQHEGILFECPVADCNSRFTYQSNITRHIKEFHDEPAPVPTPSNDSRPTKYICSEPGCGAVFKYPSRLRKHEDSHVKLDSVEAFCAEPECLKYFTNEQCLQEHVRLCHQHVICEICGMKHLRKNIKRHIQMHEGTSSSKRIKCTYEGCLHTFSTASNLNQHIKAVHLEIKPFSCSFPDCNSKFAFKHARDRHEQSCVHVFTPGDFVELDEQFRSRPRGGVKRKCPTIETLMTKRINPFSESELDMINGQEGDSQQSSTDYCRGYSEAF